MLVFVDDLGWADLGCYGNTFNETPHIDRLASQGVRFTQFYAGPVCSPTRANLQSGRDQARYGITQHIPGHRRPYAKLIDPEVPPQLPLSVETFAEQLGAAGYQTGYFGKWHLGNPQHGPDRQGWQTAITCGGHLQPPRVTGNSESQRTAQFLTEHAIEFIQKHQHQPFLVQISHTAVHIPLQVKPDLLERFESKPPMEGYPSRPDYAALLAELDESVGTLMQALDDMGLADQTQLWFFSDNGGLEHMQNGEVVTSNAPLRSEKGTLYEGGIRVPAIIRWPGHVPPGTQCDVPTCTLDVYPTLLELSDARPPQESLDGVSILRLLKNPGSSLSPRSLFWHLPHYHHSTPASAIRHGDWKLIEFFEDDSLELYDLRSDLSESKNLAAEKPQLAKQLRDELHDWRSRVNARIPEPNPDYDPARADELARGKRKQKQKQKQ